MTLSKNNFLGFLESKGALNETKDQLDISILSADKYLTSDKKLQELLDSPCVIEAKTDGVKLTVLKVNDKGNLNDYIFAYKNSILYPEEFDYQTITATKMQSIGSSQFKLVFRHFAKLEKNTIPVGTELQVEYLMNKPTLSSKYKHPHGMVLIGYSKSTYTAEFGKLKTKNSGMHTEKRDQYAKMLKINVPLKIFEGILGAPNTFERGIISKDLAGIYSQSKNAMHWENIQDTWNNIKQMLLSIPSAFGGTEEGVVIKYNNMLLKVQQSYQVDQTARAKIKAQFREDDKDKENLYWKNVNLCSLKLVQGVKVSNINQALQDLALRLKRLKLDFGHSKKSDVNIKDDIQLSAKNLLLRGMKGNNGCLILGKFRVLTSGHAKLIKTALKQFDRVCVCLVSSKDTKETFDLRLKMMKNFTEQFGNKVEIISYNTGNILGILRSVPFNVNGVYAGSDRVADYQRQLSSMFGMNVHEIPRNDADISATKVIENIQNEDYFQKNTPREIWKMYPEILKTYSK